MAGAPYEIALVHVDGRAEFRLAGEFDLAAAPDLRRELFGRLSAAIPVVVDMSDAGFVDSTALGVFIEAYKFAAEQQSTFRLVNVPAQFTKVLEVTGMTKLAG
ncbi:MAG: STAS domain-containing protein [Acidimicrobiia bacterium]